MSGAYHMMDEGGEAFDIAIPRFTLEAPTN
jgi:uncharacterized protein affecting Mg2+/Co2+ transport